MNSRETTSSTKLPVQFTFNLPKQESRKLVQERRKNNERKSRTPEKVLLIESGNKDRIKGASSEGMFNIRVKFAYIGRGVKFYVQVNLTFVNVKFCSVCSYDRTWIPWPSYIYARYINDISNLDKSTISR